MKMSNKVYDVMKKIVTIIIPAVIACYSTIAATLNLPYTEAIITIVAAVDTCLGTCLGISSYNYNKAQNVESEDEDIWQ